ncbi:MAG: hypothetical protein JO276_13865 [Sphingomonadaceae bacterium]|nr:hypothetical protein [Sphingomonadaceae bacterium]
MRISSLLTAAGIAAASLTGLASAPASAQLTVAVGPPVGPGWYRWHDRRFYPGGPAYYRIRGPHYGWYRWHDDYYRNCSWHRVSRHVREWRCW